MTNEQWFADNQANWNDRAALHAASGYGIQELIDDPSLISPELAQDLHRFGNLTDRDVIHLQCHLGTDTIGFARAVERFAAADSWRTISPNDTEQILTLAALPSAERDDDEDAKRFDYMILRRQLAQLDGDVMLAERVREAVQEIAVGLLSLMNIPSVAAQAALIESVAGVEWWVDVTLPMLEHARRKLRGLVGLDHDAAREAFEQYLDHTRFSADQIRFVNLIVDELTKNGVMAPGRLFESPYTDHAPAGSDYFFPESELEIIADTLRQITDTAVPIGAA